MNDLTCLQLAEEVGTILIRGGWVMLPIYLLGLFAWFLVFSQYGLILDYRKNQLEQSIKTIVAHTLEKNHYIDELIAEERAKAWPVLRKHLSTISRFAALAPMLGLLGTVTGMRSTFSTIMQHGFGNPVLLADGISEALLTTQAGLIVAFPLILAHNRLKRSSEKTIAQLETALLRERNRFLNMAEVGS